MEYQLLTLFGCGIFGILVHNLIKIDQINRKLDGGFKFSPFMRLEWPSIVISFCVVCVALIARTEIKQLKELGNYLMLGFFAIGYMAQSIVYHFMGKAEKKLQQ